MPPVSKADSAVSIAEIIAAFPVPMLPDGIYINLSNERYHADPALGSSNIKDILKGANHYWHKSWMNPKRKKKNKTPALIVGNAMHALLLEGRKVFDQRYIRGPYDSTYEGSSSDKSALTKAAKKDLLEGQELIEADIFDFLLGVKQIIDADPELEGILDGGLCEVSIFWTRPDGVRCKARLDMLKLRGIGDLKSIANERERELGEACYWEIKTRRYDIPVAQYGEGRRQMARLLDHGKVFICTEHCSEHDEPPTLKTFVPDPDDEKDAKLLDYLVRCAAADNNFAFQMIFVPKPAATGDTAPDCYSYKFSPGNPAVLSAETDIETAIDYYKLCLERFGTAQRWVPGREVVEFSIDDRPVDFHVRAVKPARR